jgi:hypothetical protein
MGAAGLPSVYLGNLISTPPLGGELSYFYLVHILNFTFHHHSHHAGLSMKIFRVQLISLSMRMVKPSGEARGGRHCCLHGRS